MSHETLESLSPTQKLLAMLNLAPGGASAHEHVFSALTLTKESPRIFGGQVLAQAIMAAAHTVEGKTLHSLHGYFLRPGDVEGDLSYGAEALNDARSFSTRRVQAYQGGQPIFSCITSFQVPAQAPTIVLPCRRIFLIRRAFPQLVTSWATYRYPSRRRSPTPAPSMFDTLPLHSM